MFRAAQTPMKHPDTHTTRTSMSPSACTLALFAATLACSIVDDDEPTPGGSETTGGDGPTCLEVFLEFAQTGSCPYPMTPSLVADLGGETVFWIDDPSNGTSIGPNGAIFENIAEADWIAYVVTTNGDCQIACAVPKGHPCFQEEADICAGGFGQGNNPGCLYCGETTIAACENFLATTCPSGGSGGNETSPTTSGDETSPGGDETAPTGQEGIVDPDISMFTDHPDALFGTTQYVLDLLGSAAPPNLVAEGLCDIWKPEDAVYEWFGDPVFDKDVFDAIADRAERFLGYCDKLRITLTENGLRLKHVNATTLAAELGFQTGDEIISVNDVPATDWFALRDEVMALSQTGGVAEVTYFRGSITSHITIRVQ